MKLPRPHVPHPPEATNTSICDVPETQRETVLETLASMKSKERQG